MKRSIWTGLPTLSQQQQEVRFHLRSKTFLWPQQCLLWGYCPSLAGLGWVGLVTEMVDIDPLIISKPGKNAKSISKSCKKVATVSRHTSMTSPHVWCVPIFVSTIW